MGIGGWMLLAILVALIVWGAAVYNGLITRRYRFRNDFAHVDVQLRRRHDLVPPLVETAKAYIAHERQTLDAVIGARSGAVQAAQRAAGTPGSAEAMRAVTHAETALAAALGRLFAVVEGYPQLKANQNMLALRDELTSTENRVALTRLGYNDAVSNYNICRERFPARLIAALFAFAPAAPLQTPESPEDRNRTASRASVR